ncbi:hypothetical protein T265_15095 [Opisthorchis viverrini]|uniref:Uncharacterized protein n=1 Tax=Opisthorchis viverrini TaxID=6198 RepID=A0A074Z790_OPIVI|nr:hypothetical protein T265_15095 [Opisthorchis viverrini]KER21447.1 hypothetical protein T265_15095 [Opisthorchis viverrini]
MNVQLFIVFTMCFLTITGGQAVEVERTNWMARERICSQCWKYCSDATEEDFLLGLPVKRRDRFRG